MRRSFLMLMIAMIAAGFGNLALSKGMQTIGPMEEATLLSVFDYFARTVTNPFVILGIGLELVYFIFWLLVLSETDVSWAVPMNAIEYLFVGFLAVFILGEDVTWQRWVGIVLISIGCGLMIKSHHDGGVSPSSVKEES